MLRWKGLYSAPWLQRSFDAENQSLDVYIHRLMLRGFNHSIAGKGLENQSAP